ncbi:ATP-dependent DNA ligase [Labedella phragmitis]|uniref:ATP-dependent DNA ligase n=1 Tax=Labedella phragmitis TaxID=2498849 RepID=A0A444PS43_9MICO|nr:ATP-dependent DNA ligase [Labedella phragmitis]RWZ50060.1 ATP-dependent DNA ligase [Labedella phragmitis]
MGMLKYGTREIAVEDRILAHISVIVTQKLRRRESFLLTLPASDRRMATEAMWMSCNSDIAFAYSGNRVPSLNHAWLEQMMTESFSAHGLDLTLHGEPSAAGRSAHVGTRAS